MVINSNVSQCVSDIFAVPPPVDPSDLIPNKSFCPGFLFDLSYIWVMFLRRLLVPEWARNIERTMATLNKCNKCPKIKHARRRKCPIRPPC